MSAGEPLTVAARMTVRTRLERPGAYATGPEVFGVPVYEMMTYHIPADVAVGDEPVEAALQTVDSDGRQTRVMPLAVGLLVTLMFAALLVRVLRRQVKLERKQEQAWT